MKKVEIGNAVLYHANCIDVMSEMQAGAVDHVITDVPYHANTHKMAKTNKGKGHGSTLIDFEHITDEVFESLFREFIRVSNRWVVSTCDLLQAPLLFKWDEFVRQGVWVKPNPMPQISADRPGQGYEVVMVLHGDGKKRWNGGGKAGVWNFPVVNGSQYPTQKPQQLIDRFVDDFTDNGETVLDPCMGSGTTGVSAVQAGRRFIGCEIREEAFDIACERIEQAQRQSRFEF